MLGMAGLQVSSFSFGVVNGYKLSGTYIWPGSEHVKLAGSWFEDKLARNASAVVHVSRLAEGKPLVGMIQLQFLLTGASLSCYS